MSKRKALNPDLENSLPELVPENIFESPENLELDENLSNSLHNNAFIFNPQNFDNEENPSDFSRDNGFIYNHENLENEDIPLSQIIIANVTVFQICISQH